MEDQKRKARVQQHFFEDDGRIPNNPELPLLIYPSSRGARSVILAL